MNPGQTAPTGLIWVNIVCNIGYLELSRGMEQRTNVSTGGPGVKTMARCDN